MAARPAVHQRPSVVVRSGWGIEKSFFGEVGPRCLSNWPGRLPQLLQHTDSRVVAPQNMGARDPTPGELASNFGDKVLSNWDTNHLIKCVLSRRALHGGGPTAWKNSHGGPACLGPDLLHTCTLLCSSGPLTRSGSTLGSAGGRARTRARRG
jgi:hypothetical protein